MSCRLLDRQALPPPKLCHSRGKRKLKPSTAALTSPTSQYEKVNSHFLCSNQWNINHQCSTAAAEQDS